MLRSLLRKVFYLFDLGIVRHRDLIKLNQVFIDYTCLLNKLNFLVIFEKIFQETRVGIPRNMKILNESKSQNGQDLFALLSNNFRSKGVFIEFGANDGVIFSNT